MKTTRMWGHIFKIYYFDRVRMLQIFGTSRVLVLRLPFKGPKINDHFNATPTNNSRI